MPRVLLALLLIFYMDFFPEGWRILLGFLCIWLMFSGIFKENRKESELNEYL